MKRLVVLGASNARRGLPAIVAAAHQTSAGPLQIFGAIGHGRSYGAASSVLGRRLPGILQSGIWRALEPSGGEPCDAVLIDIGNDVLYGFPVTEILGWVAECLSRLKRVGFATTVAGLPMNRLERLDRARFLLFRSILFPSSRLSLEKLIDSTQTLDEGLRRIAEEGNLRFITPHPRWYGLDPIHIRFRDSRRAWAEILGTEIAPRLPAVTALRVRAAQPERRSLFGFEIRRMQPALALEGGTELRLY